MYDGHFKYETPLLNGVAKKLPFSSTAASEKTTNTNQTPMPGMHVLATDKRKHQFSRHSNTGFPVPTHRNSSWFWTYTTLKIFIHIFSLPTTSSIRGVVLVFRYIVCCVFNKGSHYTTMGSKKDCFVLVHFSRPKRPSILCTATRELCWGIGYYCYYYYWCYTIPLLQEQQDTTRIILI